MVNTCDNCGDETTNRESKYSGAVLCNECDASIFVEDPRRKP